MSVLVIDVGTTTLRVAIVDERARITARADRRLPPKRPTTGAAIFDPGEVATVALELSRALMEADPGVRSVGLTGQRASTVLFEASSGRALGPGLGWQDQRTVGACLALRPRGVRLSPNQSATKLVWLLEQARDAPLADLRFATLDTWLAANLSGFSLHVTDATNAGVTGLVDDAALDWDLDRLERLGLPPSLLPSIVDSSGLLGEAVALPGSPMIAALVGDQQASLIGQGCVSPGRAKATFGSGAMLDCVLGPTPPPFAPRGPQGTFPIVARRIGGATTYGLEAILLAAGTCVEWLRDGLGLVGSAEETSDLAWSVRDSGGVSFVPAFGGLGTPLWDFGARGALLGLDASTTRAEVVRAVLEGIAQAGADLLEAIESDAERTIEVLALDGGMASNPAFVQLLANAIRRPIALAPVTDATTLGAALLAGCADGTWSNLAEATALLAPPTIVEPAGRSDRDRWREARSRALRTVPFLSSLEF